MRGVEVDPEDASHVLRALWWNSKAIAVLPEGIGDLRALVTSLTVDSYLPVL